MGTIPRPLLALVAAILGLCIVAGFALGILPSLRRGAAADDEEAPAAASSAASSTGIQEAQPLTEPAPPPPKPKIADKDTASDAPASDAAPAAVKPAPAAPAPTEAAPGAPPQPVAPKLPSDLPPV
jgi:translation initiation factor IF-2